MYRNEFFSIWQKNNSNHELLVCLFWELPDGFNQAIWKPTAPWHNVYNSIIELNIWQTLVNTCWKLFDFIHMNTWSVCRYLSMFFAFSFMLNVQLSTLHFRHGYNKHVFNVTPSLSICYSKRMEKKSSFVAVQQIL